MDKNNDIQVNRVSKWEAAPENIGKLKHDLRFLLDRLEVRTYDVDDPEYKELVDEIFKGLDKALDDYNELEARHQKDTGMISEYEEENKNLKSKLDIMTDDNDRLITRVFKQDEECTKLEAEHKTLQETHELCMKAHLRLCDDCTKLATENDNLRQERDKCSYRLEVLCRTLSDNDIIADWSEAAIKWNLYIWDEVKGQWCSYDKATTCESCKKHYEEELRIREKEKDEKDKLIEELNSKITMLKLRTNMIYSCYGLNPLGELNEKIKVLEKENEELKAKNSKNNDIPYGYFNLISSLRAGIEALKKENKELKDTLAKDRELGKYVGKCVADSIQEGWKNGAYELHPYMRFDIRVEETNNMSTSFDRYSIPNVVVAFNNTQTEMERDTAQHECEELNEKIDRLWSVNDELNRKIKGLTKENKELKDTLAMCERDASTARSLCHITTWEEIERELFTPEEIAESKLRVEHIGRYPWGCLGKYDKLSLQVSSLKKENNNLKQTLLDILEKLEKKVGLCRIHLLDSYENRANLIMVEHDRLLIKYEKLKKENDELKSAEDRCKVYRNSYERTVNDVRKLQEFLEKCGVPVKYRNDGTWYWDFENSAWDDTLMKDCKLIDKCRELEKENNNLTTDNKRLNNAVEAWFDMFNDMRHKRDLLKKEYKKLKETNKSCPVACECENFKPKVHHSYDPLDDLPDMEHS